jgi:hypothetical protein
MISALLAMESFRGLRWTIQRTDYSWQNKLEYSVHFRFDKDGDEVSVTRVGEDLEAIFDEAYKIFNKRIGAAFTKQELYPTAIEYRPDADDIADVG